MNTYKFRQLISIITMIFAGCGFYFIPDQRPLMASTFVGVFQTWMRSPDEDKPTETDKPQSE